MSSNSDAPIEDLSPFLRASDVLDYAHPAVAALAQQLAADSVLETAKSCFNWVRDEIEHCIDFQREEITVSASQALLVGTGFCFAKSHLLAALLRANGVACGFGYQRLILSGALPPYCLHGFVVVHLPDHGWYRCDARGNFKLGINCQFDPPHENLAYPIQYAGECTYPEIWAEPLPQLIEQLQRLDSVAQYRSAPIDFVPSL
ncbi:MAG: transglutaminase-like domain-containing protein [Deefgea sp.]